MQVKTVQVKSYLTASKLPGADFVINPYIGCPFACKYCYARFMTRFTNHTEPWGEFLDVKVGEISFKPEKLKGKRILLSSVTDCYNPYEKKYALTRRILEELHPAKAQVTILTKSDLVLRDIDLLKKFSDLTVAFSINTLDESFKVAMDRAPRVENRLGALKTLHENGIRTALFMSPMFPLLTDFRAIVEVSKAFVTEYWFENLNLRTGYKGEILHFIRRQHPEIFPVYARIYLENDVSFWLELAKEIEEYGRGHNLSFRISFHNGPVKQGL